MLRRIVDVLGVREGMRAVRSSDAVRRLWQSGGRPWKLMSARADERASAVALAQQVINEATGYARVEAHKARVAEAEKNVQLATVAARTAREAAKNARVRERELQTETGLLLERKHQWQDAELKRFTQVYRDAAGASRSARDAEQAAEDAELARDSAQGVLTEAILARYRAEQVWSDKVRALSTWGALAVLVANAVLLLLVQVVAEPWRRRRFALSVAAQLEQGLRDMARVAEERREKDRVEDRVKVKHFTVWSLLEACALRWRHLLLALASYAHQSWTYLVSTLRQITTTATAATATTLLPTPTLMSTSA